MPGRGSSSHPRIWIGQKKYDWSKPAALHCLAVQLALPWKRGRVIDVNPNFWILSQFESSHTQDNNEGIERPVLAPRLLAEACIWFKCKKVTCLVSLQGMNYYIVTLFSHPPLHSLIKYSVEITQHPSLWLLFGEHPIVNAVHVSSETIWSSDLALALLDLARASCIRRNHILTVVRHENRSYEYSFNYLWHWPPPRRLACLK